MLRRGSDYSITQLCPVNPLLFLQFARVIEDDSAAEDVGFALGEVAESKGALGLEKTLGEKDSKQNPDHAGEEPLDLHTLVCGERRAAAEKTYNEKPLPTGKVCDSSHMQTKLSALDGNGATCQN